MRAEGASTLKLQRRSAMASSEARRKKAGFSVFFYFLWVYVTFMWHLCDIYVGLYGFAYGLINRLIWFYMMVYISFAWRVYMMSLYDVFAALQGKVVYKWWLNVVNYSDLWWVMMGFYMMLMMVYSGLWWISHGHWWVYDGFTLVYAVHDASMMPLLLLTRVKCGQTNNHWPLIVGGKSDFWQGRPGPKPAAAHLITSAWRVEVSWSWGFNI